MSYPQPNSVDAILAFQQSFRLKTELRSVGDIYESEVSGLAFALGPDSDLSLVQVQYFDANANGQIVTANISPDRSLVGRVVAQNDLFLRSGRRGRILITSQNRYNNTFRPAAYSLGRGDLVTFQPPWLDVLQYFINPPSLVPQRSDREFEYQYFFPGSSVNAILWYGVPTYGRKSGFFTFKNLTALSVNITLIPVQFGNYVNGSANSDIEGTPLIATTAVAAGATLTYRYLASASGLWDYMFIQFGVGGGAGLNYVGGAFPVSITLSDDPQ